MYVANIGETEIQIFSKEEFLQMKNNRPILLTIKPQSFILCRKREKSVLDQEAECCFASLTPTQEKCSHSALNVLQMSPLLFDSLHLFFHRHATDAESTAQGGHPVLVQQAAIVLQDAMGLSSQFPL